MTAEANATATHLPAVRNKPAQMFTSQAVLLGSACLTLTPLPLPLPITPHRTLPHLNLPLNITSLLHWRSAGRPEPRPRQQPRADVLQSGPLARRADGGDPDGRGRAGGPPGQVGAAGVLGDGLGGVLALVIGAHVPAELGGVGETAQTDEAENLREEKRVC